MPPAWQPLRQPLEPLCRRWEEQAQPAGLLLVPGSADAEHGATTGQDVQRGHGPRLAHQVRHHRRVVTGAGPDLQHALTRFHTQLFKHRRHHSGLGGGADRLTVAGPLRDNRRVLVGLCQLDARHEHVPRDRP